MERDSAELNEKLALTNLKLERLLDMQLEGKISSEEYTVHKEKLLNEKLHVREKSESLAAEGNFWLKPTRKFFETASQAASMAQDGKIREFFQNVESNLTLADRRTRCEWKKPWSILADFDRMPILRDSLHFIPDT